MSFFALAFVGVIALAGPLLSAVARWRIPLVIGELLVGVLCGESGLHLLDPADPAFRLLANVGFALTMFVAGSHVPLHDARLRSALRGGILRAVAVAAVAAALGLLLGAVFGTGHGAVYAVVMASSSAALVLPAVDELGLGGPTVLSLIAQVAVADAATIVILPLVLDPVHAGRAALGTVVIAAAALALSWVLRYVAPAGRRRAHQVSERRNLALELRISLIVLFSLGAVAIAMHVSVMLAGFAAGLVVAAIGEPRRLARQLFAVSDGFLSPLFFVWLGASLTLGPVLASPRYALLGVALGAGAIVAHAVMRVFRQPLSAATIASAQLGVPVAAATIGTQTGLLNRGEPAALLLGALVTVGALSIASGAATRSSALSTRT